MKTLISMLVGITTLLAGSIGSVATADHHKHEYIITGINHTTGHKVVLMNTSDSQTTVALEVTDQNSRNVGSDTTLTLLPYRMSRVLRSTDMTETIPGGLFRTVRIFSDVELYVSASRVSGSGARNIPVYHRILPCDHGTYRCPKDDDDEGTKGNHR